MLVSRTCGVPCARGACGAAAADRLLLQEQLAFVTDHLGLLRAHHRQLCQQQQDLITEWRALAVGTPTRVWTFYRILTQGMGRDALWWESHAWSEQHRTLHAQLRHIGGTR